MSRRDLTDDLLLPQPSRQSSIETMMVPRRIAAESAPTVLLRAVVEKTHPSGLIGAEKPPRPSSMTFLVVLLAISLASVAAGVLIAPIIN